jgi:hypothetical protein
MKKLCLSIFSKSEKMAKVSFGSDATQHVFGEIGEASLLQIEERAKSWASHHRRHVERTTPEQTSFQPTLDIQALD